MATACAGLKPNTSQNFLNVIFPVRLGSNNVCHFVTIISSRLFAAT
uniref:Uncharacterized protein n=1 Tax=Schistosoma japonicum TaxID=6182 RepID=Q5BZB4_SCHJA|nr:unknown [Schistosoma japonicum]